jgi:hypothetical protein
VPSSRIGLYRLSQIFGAPGSTAGWQMAGTSPLASTRRRTPGGPSGETWWDLHRTCARGAFKVVTSAITLQSLKDEWPRGRVKETLKDGRGRLPDGRSAH